MRTTVREALIDIDTAVASPYWALLERQLLDAQAQACAEFFDRYFDDRGYLLCVPRWSGDDGPDDALENLLNWTMLHALGADDRVLALFRKGMEGHFRQYTEAKNDRRAAGPRRHVLPGVPRLLRLDAPRRGLVADHPARALRAGRPRAAAPYAALGRDVHGRRTHIPNYDPQHRVIRSLLQRVARAPAAPGDRARLGGRPHRCGGPVPDACTGKPRTRRCSTTSATTPTSSVTTR